MAGTGTAALTKVQLEYRAEEYNYRLLFGRPVAAHTDVTTFGYTRQHAWFAAGSLFALDLWQGAPIRNAAGELRTRTTARACLILQAGSIGDRLEKLPRVNPGAHVLVRVHGQRRCKFFLAWLTALQERCAPELLDAEFFDLKSIAIRCLVPEHDLPEAIGFPTHVAAY